VVHPPGATATHHPVTFLRIPRTPVCTTPPPCSCIPVYPGAGGRCHRGGGVSGAVRSLHLVPSQYRCNTPFCGSGYHPAGATGGGGTGVLRAASPPWSRPLGACTPPLPAITVLTRSANAAPSSLTTNRICAAFPPAKMVTEPASHPVVHWIELTRSRGSLHWPVPSARGRRTAPGCR